MLERAVLLVAVCAAPAVSQPASPGGVRSDVEYARNAWREVHGYLGAAAATAPDSLFAFRPTPEVRTFGETLDHVAASERGYCEIALGQPMNGGGSGTGAKTMA